MKSNLLILLSISFLMFSCSKVEGPGGKATIRGKVTKQNMDVPEYEVLEIQCPSADITNGWGTGGSISDYFLLNTPTGYPDYYFYYTIGGIGPDPVLAGRTGVLVALDGTDDNLAVATKTKNAIVTGAGVDWVVQQNNDVLTVTCKRLGYCVDAEEWNTALNLDVKNQGESANAGPMEDGDDERVYIKYGDADIYGDDFRTDHNGNYVFSGLTKGNYIIYLQSLDETTGADTLVQTGVTISGTKDEIIVDDINIFY